MKKTIAMFLTVSMCLCGLTAFSASEYVFPYAIKKDMVKNPKLQEIADKFYDDVKSGKDIKDAIIEYQASRDDFQTKRIGKLVFLEETADAYIFKADPHNVGKMTFHKSLIKQIMDNVGKRRQLAAKQTDATDKKQTAGK